MDLSMFPKPFVFFVVFCSDFSFLSFCHGEAVLRRIRGSDCDACLAVMQTDQPRFFVEHHDEEIIVVVLRDVDRL
jgi:hypothetical protein